MAGSFSMGLRRLTNRTEGVSEDLQHCMSFEDYADAIEQAHAEGNAPRLNAHFRPQHLSCPVPGGADLGQTPTFAGLVAEASGLLKSLHNFGFKRASGYAVQHTHITPRGDWEPSQAVVDKLCRISRDEYIATQLPLPEFCMGVLSKQRGDANAQGQVRVLQKA
jgi:hypothetical protein